MVIFALVFYVLLVVAQWKIFTKAGKPGWHSIIPILNVWDLVNIAWNKKMAGVMVGLTALVGLFSGITNAQGEDASAFIDLLSGIAGLAYLVVFCMFSIKLSKSFGHGTGFGIGLILLSGIFYLILGFGSSQYIGPEGNPAVYQGGQSYGGNPFDNGNPYA